MSKHLMKCQVCGEYTMKLVHHDKKTLSPRPMKYSPEDKFGEYRRRAKKEKGLA